MPNRSYTAGTQFRYGFNGKENDNDVKGTGNQQDYGMRIYDTRIGKFLSVDPLAYEYAELTPYQYASNIPTSNIDLDGLEGTQAIVSQSLVGRGPMIKLPQPKVIIPKLPMPKFVNPSFKPYGGPGGGGGLALRLLVVDWLLFESPLAKKIDKKVDQLDEKYGFVLFSYDIGQATFYKQQHKKFLGETLRIGSPLAKAKVKSNDKVGSLDDDFASVRFQVQQGSTNHISNANRQNSIEEGVTKSQGYSALEEIYNKAIEKDPSLADNKDFKSAIIRMSEKINSIRGGLSRGVNYTTLQEKFEHKNKTYRIDVEVQRGENFKK